MRKTLVGVVLMAASAAAFGQEFEVVSVKPNRSLSDSSHSNSDDGRYTGTNLSLANLIAEAYGIRDYQLEGPDWIRSEKFDIAAQFPDALPQDPVQYNAALGAMMQKMLADRFKLTIHRQQKPFTVYGLAVAKNGIKFKEVPDTGSHSSKSNKLQFTGTCISMEGFAGFLARRVELPVIDMTGLKGFYDLKLAITPLPPVQPGEPPDSPGAIMSIALQEQLGLKLETRKAPIEVIVVDHAEKVPTDN
jgi:uncharacterized protein (TIGR03435 family)